MQPLKSEGVARDDSSEADDESIETEIELDLTTLGRGNAQLKKKSTKKKKGSDEEDTTYTPSAEETKKLRIKQKAVHTGVIPRNVHAKKSGATLSKDQGGKKEKHVETSKVHEAEKIQSNEGNGDDEVEITGVRASTPPPPPKNLDIQESSQPKKTVLPDMFEGFPNVRGEYKDDFIPGDDFDMFHDADFKELKKKVSVLEQEKAKAEAERDLLKKQVEELMKTHEEIKKVMIKQEKKLKNMQDDVNDNSKFFEVLSAEISELNVKNEKLNDINKSLNQMISELHEASAYEFKAMKLEMEAMKVDKVMKVEQLNMLYTVRESHLNLDVRSVFNNIEIKKTEDRRVERERRLAEEATQRRKGLVVDTEEILGSSSQPTVGGSSSQVDVEMVDVEAVQSQGFVLVEEEEEEKEDEEMDFWMNEIDNYDFANDKDDDDQGSSGLLIVNPNIQQKIKDFLNDEINEQEEDLQQESSSSGKQHVDQVFLTQPIVIYLHARYEGEIEVPRSRAEMLEELGLEDGVKFDIEDEIPPSPEREYEFKYAQEADQKIVEKITTEGVPRTKPRENLAEERKKWFKVMPKERKFLRPLQYSTHNADISWGDILSWGYLEDLQVYAIRREQGVQYFEYLSDIKTLPWWDVDELV
ncbi:hypothetical protein Hanom_Chr01g00062041 [Helianthus anomalus]